MFALGIEPFDGGHHGPRDGAQRSDTGSRGAPLDMNRAGAAESNPAAEFGSSQAQFIANHPEQWRVLRTVNGNDTPIELECGHDLLAFCLMGRRLPANSGNLLFHVAPGWKFCTGAA